MNYQGAIFDLDGVIVDTAKYHCLAWREIANVLGVPFSDADNERLKGVSRMQSLEILLSMGNLQLSEEEKLRLTEQKNASYRNMLQALTKADILPGAAELLHALRAAGIKTALGSGSKNASFILDRLEIRDLFDAIADGTCITKAKPDPEVFCVAAKLLGLPPATLVVFEDAAAGVTAALRGGMYPVGIGQPEILRDAAVVLPDLTQTANILAIFNRR